MKRKNKLQTLLVVSLFSFLFFPACLSAQKQVSISGKANDYAGKEVSFYTYTEPILHQRHELGSVRVAGDGKFSLTMSLSETTEIYADLEKYRGTMVVEPGKSYAITLPPYSARTAIEARSAFFEPALYWLGIEDKDPKELNLTIRRFISAFNQETSKHTNEIYRQGSKEAVAKVIEHMDSQFAEESDPYFKTLKTYSYAELEYAVNQRTPEKVIEKYFAREPLKIHHPAYQKVFLSLFTDFLSKEAKDFRNGKIVTLVNSGNLPGLIAFFTARGYSKQFAELVVVKGLYDGYYSGSFDKESVLKALERARTEVTAGALNPTIHQIVKKLSTMKTGGKAPAFSLKNRQGTVITPDKFKGKYVYLVFFRSDSPESRAELDSIVPIEKKLRQVLSIVPVALDDNFANAEKLWKDKRYTWDLLNGSKQKALIEDYNIRVAPTFYLLAPDGTFLLAQAPPPSRDFESLFLKIYREYNFKHPQPRPRP